MTLVEQDTRQEKANRKTRLGDRVREIRRARGMTIQQVAERSGLAISTISKIERNLMAPTYDRFSQLAEGLDIDLAELFASEGSRFGAGELAVARAGDCMIYETENYTYEMLFSDLRYKAMVPMLGNLKPFEQIHFDGLISHRGEEFVTVLSGRVTVHLEDMDPITLDIGDSMYFDSRRGHLYASAGETPARILVVCTKLKADRDDPGSR